MFQLSKPRTEEVKELEQREEDAGVAEHVDEGEAGDEHEQEGGGRGTRVVEAELQLDDDRGEKEQRELRNRRSSWTDTKVENERRRSRWCLKAGRVCQRVSGAGRC